MKLDSKDRVLLSLLIRNGRLTNRQLAREVDLSPSACLSRVRKLEAAGIIAGYKAVMGPGHGERGVEAWAGVRLGDVAQGAARRILELIEATPEIIEAHRIAGPYDFVLRFCAPNLAAWTRFQQELSAIDEDAQSRLSVLLEPVK